MWDLAKHHSWTLQLKAPSNVVLCANLLAQWHPHMLLLSILCFQRYYILLERSDLLVEVSVLLCSTCDHSYSACESLPQEAGKVPKAMDEKKYVDAVVVSPPGSIDPVLKPSSAILPAT